MASAAIEVNVEIVVRAANVATEEDIEETIKCRGNKTTIMSRTRICAETEGVGV